MFIFQLVVKQNSLHRFTRTRVRHAKKHAIKTIYDSSESKWRWEFDERTTEIRLIEYFFIIDESGAFLSSFIFYFSIIRLENRMGKFGRQNWHEICVECFLFSGMCGSTSHRCWTRVILWLIVGLVRFRSHKQKRDISIKRPVRQSVCHSLRTRDSY